MGEMADFFNEEIVTNEEAKLEYLSGHMDDTEAFDRGIIDELGYMYHSHKPISSSLKSCKYCHKSNLRWKETDKGWRLVDSKNEVHVCKDYAL